MKVYRRMDIGTAKPSAESRRQVAYHLIDVVEPSESFSVAAFVEGALQAIEQIRSRGKRVIAVGGTALYIKALLYGLFEGPGSDEQVRQRLRKRSEAEGIEQLHRELREIDPEAAERIDANDARRIVRALEVCELTGKPISHFQKQWESQNTRLNWTIIGLRREKAEENSRINARVKRMISAGLVDEVRALLAEDKPLSQQARCAIGYAEIIEHLAGLIDLEYAVEQIKKNTRRFAKSQRTWFKTFRDVNWLDIESGDSDEHILSRAKSRLKNTP
jgi:tRNA dimethylallyltransferase